MKLNINIPDDYCDRAKKELAEVIEILNADPSVSKIDAPAVNLLGSYMNTYYKAQAIVEKEGMIIRTIGQSGSMIRKAHPACKIAHDAGMKMYRLLVQFNMTPESRQKNGKEHGNEPQSPLELLLGNKVEMR